jgi:hypothetical protein
MQLLSNYAIAFVIALLVFPSTTSSQGRPEQSQTPPTKFVKSKKPIPNRYIVVLNDDVVSSDAPLEVRRARITAIAGSHAQTYGGKFDYIYETALKGYAIELPNEAAAIAISNLPEVKWVEEDGRLEPALGVVVPKTPEPVCGGKPVAISLLDTRLPGRRTSFRLNGGITERGRFVIRDRDALDKLWQQLHRAGSDKPPLPGVDFSREMIIVAAMGQQPTSGYESIIDSACEADHQLEVLVRSTNFLKCGGQTTSVTAPVDIVRLPKTDLPVVFRETEVTSDCKDFLRAKE